MAHHTLTTTPDNRFLESNFGLMAAPISSDANLRPISSHISFCQQTTATPSSSTYVMPALDVSEIKNQMSAMNFDEIMAYFYFGNVQ